jgi:hypothetical protein
LLSYCMELYLEFCREGVADQANDKVTYVILFIDTVCSTIYGSACSIFT